MPTRKRTIIAVDFDGTLVTKKWPGIGEWMPGATEAVRTWLRAGCVVLLWSTRLSPYGLDGKRRPDEEVQAAIAAVRAKLDEGGLAGVHIWTREGKPPAHVFVDDRAERYNPTNRAWQRLTERVLMRAGLEEHIHPDGEWGWEDDG